jgi:hypothetical protein
VVHRALLGRGLVLLSALVASLPVIVSTGKAIDLGWVPSSDDGVIAVRAFDVLSGETPLLGQYSQASALIGEPLHNLGPLLVWVLAIPAQIGPDAFLVVMGAINVACIVGVVVLARRRGGVPLVIAAAIALPLLSRGLPAEVPYEIFNPWAALFPLTLLLFVGWSVACGEYALMPLLVLVSSFIVQCHVTYLFPVAATVLVAVVGLVIWRRGHRVERGHFSRWVVVTGFVALVCWSGPLIDEVEHRPGNIVLVVRSLTAERPRSGTEAGLHALGRTIGVPPGWVKAAPTPGERIVQQTTPPGGIAMASAALVFAAIVGTLLLAWRRRRHDVAMAAALSLLLCASVTVVARSIPTDDLGFSTLPYILTWSAVVGMWVWLTVAWSGWVLFQGVRGAVAPRVLAPAAFLGLAAGAAIGVAAFSRPSDDANRQPPGSQNFTANETATARATEAVGGDRVLITVPRGSIAIPTVWSTLVYELRRGGLTVALPGRHAVQLGSRYYPADSPYRTVIGLADGNAPAAPGSQVIVRYPRDFTITVSHPH